MEGPFFYQGVGRCQRKTTIPLFILCSVLAFPAVPFLSNGPLAPACIQCALGPPSGASAPPQGPHQALVAEEGDGVDGERPGAVQQEAPEEHPGPLLPGTDQDAVGDPAVVPAPGPGQLQPGLDHVHGRGTGPGHHARGAPRHQHGERAWEGQGARRHPGYRYVDAITAGGHLKLGLNTEVVHIVQLLCNCTLFLSFLPAQLHTSCIEVDTEIYLLQK